ncbi:hypothetical protein F5050DRAFT_760335 [Lentinula boryana]|uniref:Uncharacterized protein n=1 Tax=Lentinula boryana TaxID=40481 RepID=A0ABQ8Q3Z5_9AGAR|nr:hypothetical protein F5050DRAFT_760335 [Lentinula boryana]
MAPPPPPLFPICLTPHAKESFPVVQSAHQHLRNASDTIHQHRNSLASQLRVFDSRWAHLFSVAPVLNKLTKGRQRPDEFHKNAEILDEDIQVALVEARGRKYSQARVADEQDSVVPGPFPGPPSDSMFTRVSRKALSSIMERVERGDQIQPETSKTSKSPYGSSKTSRQSKNPKNRAISPTKTSLENSRTTPSKLKVNQTSSRRPVRVSRKESRHSIRSMRSFKSMRSSSPFRHPKPKPSSRDRHKTTTGRDRERERDWEKERDPGREHDYRDRENRDIGKERARSRERERDRDRDKERNRDRERDSRDRDKQRDRDRERDKERERDRSSRERDKERDRYRDREANREHTQRPSRSHSRHHHHHRLYQDSKYPTYTKSPENSGQPPVPSAAGIPSNLPPIYARFATEQNYEDAADLEPLEPPVLPFVTERMEKRRKEGREHYDNSRQQYQYHHRDHGRHNPPPSSYHLQSSSYYPQNPPIPYDPTPPDGRGRGRERADYSKKSGHPRAGYNGYEDHTYSSTSTPVINTLPNLPNSSAPMNTNIVIPAPSSNRHLSRSRYPPSSSRNSRSPYLRTREEYGYKGNRNGWYDGYGHGYNGEAGYSSIKHPQAPQNPRPPYPPPSTRSPRSPLIMRSKFKENFSVLQSESGQ